MDIIRPITLLLGNDIVEYFKNAIKKSDDLLNDNNIHLINPNSKFQWYSLDNLNDDINKLSYLYPNEKVFNLFTEPLETREIINLFPNYSNISFSENNYVEYNFKTKFSSNGYISDKISVINQIKKFIKNEFIRK